MKRSTQILLTAAILLSLRALSGSGMEGSRPGDGSKDPISVGPVEAGRPVGAPPEPRLRPARKSDRVERVTAPGVADLPTVRFAAGYSSSLLPAVRPAGRFLKQTFRRYRPRDPTIS